MDELLPKLRSEINEIITTLHKDITDILSLNSSIDIFSTKVPFVNRGCVPIVGIGPDSDKCDIFFLTEKPNFVKQLETFGDDAIKECDKFNTVGKEYYKLFDECIIDNTLKSRVRYVNLCPYFYKKDSTPENIEDVLKLYVPFLLKQIELFKPRIVICYSSLVWRVIMESKVTDVIKTKIQLKGKYILLETPDDKFSVKFYKIDHPYIILEKDGTQKRINSYKTTIKNIIKENFSSCSSIVDPKEYTKTLMKTNANDYMKQNEKKKLAKNDKKVDIEIYRKEKYNEKLKEKNRTNKFNDMSKGTNSIQKYVKKFKTEE